MLNRLFEKFDQFIHSPLQVLFFGGLLTILLLIYDGSLWRFWSLQTGQQDLQERMVDLEAKAKKLEFKIHQAKQLTYIERQATDQFDYVREGDLIFVFSD